MPDILASENFEGASLQELLNARTKLEGEIRARQSVERTKALAEIRQIMATHGLTVKDLGAAARRGSSRGAAAEGDDSVPAKRPIAPPSTKVRAKFRDPETGDSWTGRGMTPKWLRDHEEAGRPRAKYLIAK